MKRASPSETVPSSDMLSQGRWERGRSLWSSVGPVDTSKSGMDWLSASRSEGAVPLLHMSLYWLSFPKTYLQSKWKGGDLVILETDLPRHSLQGDLGWPLLQVPCASLIPNTGASALSRLSFSCRTSFSLLRVPLPKAFLLGKLLNFQNISLEDQTKQNQFSPRLELLKNCFITLYSHCRILCSIYDLFYSKFCLKLV